MGKTILCHCEDVDVEEVHAALKQGFGDLETLRRYTGIGTGKCQGKCCLIQTLRILASLAPATAAPAMLKTPDGGAAITGDPRRGTPHEGELRAENPREPAETPGLTGDPRRIHLPTIRPPVLPLRIDDIIEAHDVDEIHEERS